VLTSFGIIHDNALHWPDITNPLVWGYLIVAAILWLASRNPLVNELGDEGGSGEWGASPVSMASPADKVGGVGTVVTDVGGPATARTVDPDGRPGIV